MTTKEQQVTLPELPPLPNVVAWTEQGSPRYLDSQMHAYARAYAAACVEASRASREGWVSVPKEPTEAMINAVYKAHRNKSDAANLLGRKSEGLTDAEIYRAMIAAAQEKEEGK